jgi:Phosphopantetheine attachment site
MLGAWQRVFADEVSVDDSFFELGGNSLLVVRLCAAMQEERIAAVQAPGDLPQPDDRSACHDR